MADLDLALKTAFEQVFGPAVTSAAQPTRKAG